MAKIVYLLDSQLNPLMDYCGGSIVHEVRKSRSAYAELLDEEIVEETEVVLLIVHGCVCTDCGTAAHRLQRALRDLGALGYKGLVVAKFATCDDIWFFPRGIGDDRLNEAIGEECMYEDCGDRSKPGNRQELEESGRFILKNRDSLEKSGVYAFWPGGLMRSDSRLVELEARYEAERSALTKQLETEYPILFGEKLA